MRNGALTFRAADSQTARTPTSQQPVDFQVCQGHWQTQQRTAARRGQTQLNYTTTEYNAHESISISLL